MFFNGLNLAFTELSIFFVISYLFKIYYNFNLLNSISYYWIMFTILTGIWEFFYIIHKKEVTIKSKILIDLRKHVWTSNYNMYDLLPHRFSKIFYSEYGAYADKQYIVLRNRWSIVIEGTHCDFCAFISFLAVNMINLNIYLFYFFTTIAMSCQLMNSILYMSEYMIQTKEISNPNFDSIHFPTGYLLSKRPFMWINIFWTIMPIFVIMNTCYNIILTNYS